MCAFTTLEGRNIVKHVSTYLSNNSCILGSLLLNLFWALFLFLSSFCKLFGKADCFFGADFLLGWVCLILLGVTAELVGSSGERMDFAHCLVFHDPSNEKRHHPGFLAVAYCRTS